MQDPREVVTSAEASENMRKSFALQKDSGSSNFADVWEVKKKECFSDVACKSMWFSNVASKCYVGYTFSCKTVKKTFK